MTELDNTSPKQGNPAWVKGVSQNPKGRPKGSRNALGEDFLKALLDDFRAPGANGKPNGEKAIIDCRTDKPVEYVKIIAGLLPKEMTLNLNPLEDMEDAELTNAIRAIEAAIIAVVSGTGEAEGGTPAKAQDAQAAVLPSLH